ncbi:MAG: phytoene desaturase family protein [Bacteroidetes bacterium]|jgi:diapolycopene oxygenase|nr:phytoene desaturase family protein [Bacteroidota bacterium]
MTIKNAGSIPAKRALIIGAGIAGIATAIRLQLKGYQVLVIEANTYPGGKLTVIEQDGYRFDAGPSLFTMPHFVDELFALAGKNPRKYFNYIKKNESCRYFWDDGVQLTASADQNEFAGEVERKLDVPAKAVLKRLQQSRKIFELAGGIFMEKPLNRLATWFSKDVLKSLLNLHQLSLFSTMHQANTAALKNPKLVQLFDRYATYNGSDPYRAPGILNIIPHLEHGVGTFLPQEGMYQITSSLVKLAEDLGVRFNLNERVEEILLKEQKVTGVRSSKGIHTADLVISNMDVTPTYRKLLPLVKAPERKLSQERSSSALIFYWGIKAEFEQLGLHNIFFSKDYRKEFQDIFEGIVPPDDPTVYVNITSKDIPSDAPKGCENWFVMVNVPPHSDQDWQQLIPLYRERIISKLNKILVTDLSPLINTEATLSPLDIELKTSSAGGSLYGTSSNSRYAAFLRHTNDHQSIEGLYFTGGSVHPGGGIPLCLLSAKIVSEITPNL